MVSFLSVHKDEQKQFGSQELYPTYIKKEIMSTRVNANSKDDVKYSDLFN